MPKRLSDQIITKLPRPATGNKKYYDAPNAGATAGRRALVSASLRLAPRLLS